MIQPADTSEKTVLGAIMRWEPIADEHQISPDDFLGSRKLAEWVLKSPGRGTEILKQHIEDAGDLEGVGGYEAIDNAFIAAPSTPATIGEHMVKLRDRVARKYAYDAASAIHEAARDVAAGDYLAAMGEPITVAIEQALGMQPAQDTASMVDEAMANFCDRLSGRRTPMGIRTGISEWDCRFKGLHDSHLIVISGYPAGGKTVLAGQVAWASASIGHRTLFCSMEITGPQLVDRLATMAAGIEGTAMVDPLAYKAEHGLNGDFERQVCDGFFKVRSSPLVIEDLIGADIDRVIGTIRRAHRRQPVRVAVVDFIQRVRPSAAMAKQNREQQLSADVNRLADLTKELGVTLIVPSQLNKEGAAKHAEAINEAADLHLRIEPEQRGIRVVKDRHFGHTGAMLEVALDPDTVKFTEDAHNPEDSTPRHRCQ